MLFAKEKVKVVVKFYENAKGNNMDNNIYE